MSVHKLLESFYGTEPTVNVRCGVGFSFKGLRNFSIFQHGSMRTPQTNITLPCDEPKSSNSNANIEPKEDIKYDIAHNSVAQYFVNNPSHMTSFQFLVKLYDITVI